MPLPLATPTEPPAVVRYRRSGDRRSRPTLLCAFSPDRSRFTSMTDARLFQKAAEAILEGGLLTFLADDGADHVAHDAVQQRKDSGILEIVTPSLVLAEHEALRLQCQVSSMPASRHIDPRYPSNSNGLQTPKSHQDGANPLAGRKVPADHRVPVAPP